MWQIFPFFFPFLCLCLLSCLCNRLYILPQLLSLSLLPLCQFLLALVFPFPTVPPAPHMHSYFLLHPLSPVFAALARSFCESCCLSTGLSLHTHLFPVIPFHGHMQDLHIYNFGDASQNRRLSHLHSPVPRLIFSHSQQITTVILSLFLSVSQTAFSNTCNPLCLPLHSQTEPALTLCILSLLFLPSHSFLPPYHQVSLSVFIFILHSNREELLIQLGLYCCLMIPAASLQGNQRKYCSLSAPLSSAEYAPWAEKELSDGTGGGWENGRAQCKMPLEDCKK